MTEKKDLPQMLPYVFPTRENALRLAADEHWEKTAAKHRRRNRERWEIK